MAWIESHQSLQRHPKTVALARSLHVSKMAAIGHLHALWWWALDYAPSGSLAGVEDATIADACEWRKDPTVFVQALIDAKGPSGRGFVDRNRTIHDWDEYAGRMIAKRAADAERKRKGRSADSPPDPKSDGAETSDGHPPDGAGTVPDLDLPTVPTGPDQPKTVALASRTRDVLFESLAMEYFGGWSHLTPKARSEVNAALREIRTAGDATPDEIGKRAEHHRLSDLGTPTVSAFAKYWPMLAKGPINRGNGRAPTPTERRLEQVRDWEREEARRGTE